MKVGTLWEKLLKSNKLWDTKGFSIWGSLDKAICWGVIHIDDEEKWEKCENTIT